MQGTVPVVPDDQLPVYRLMSRTLSLSAVTVISAKNAWAVGSTSTAKHASFETLIHRWNGKAWS
jgi:hypothetical protein